MAWVIRPAANVSKMSRIRSNKLGERKPSWEAAVVVDDDDDDDVTVAAVVASWPCCEGSNDCTLMGNVD